MCGLPWEWPGSSSWHRDAADIRGAWRGHRAAETVLLTRTYQRRQLLPESCWGASRQERHLGAPSLALVTGDGAVTLEGGPGGAPRLQDCYRTGTRMCARALPLAQSPGRPGMTASPTAALWPAGSHGHTAQCPGAVAGGGDAGRGTRKPGAEVHRGERGRYRKCGRRAAFLWPRCESCWNNTGVRARRRSRTGHQAGHGARPGHGGAGAGIYGVVGAVRTLTVCSAAVCRRSGSKAQPTR